MGLPSIPAYIITATMTAPALAAFAGAGLSGGNPMYTGFQALKLSLAGFLIPYFFVYEPSLLMIDPSGLETSAKEFPLPAFSEVALHVTTAVIGIIGFCAALEGYFRTNINIVLRIRLFGGALASIIPGLLSDGIGLTIILLVFAFNFLKDKRKTVGTM